jgi:hypothetical protein
MDNEQDRDFMRQCEELADSTQNPTDRARWQRAAASFRKMAGDDDEEQNNSRYDENGN